MDNLFTALATIIVALILGSAVSKIHDRNNPIGDRIFLGLLSVPFIVILINAIDKNLHWLVKLLPTIPVVVYTTLLLLEDNSSKSSKSVFSIAIYVSTILVNIVFLCVFFVR
jgi:Na+/H+-dicarboxylate symporter